MSVISYQKLAERLFILNDRQLGVLTRIYHMKQLLSANEYRPAILPGSDKAFDAGWKVLLKKFPSLEVKPANSSVQPFIDHHKEYFGIISSYYFNLVDVLEIRDHVNELLVTMSSAQLVLDVTVNFDITRLYLEIISNHFALMFMISRISDVKPILALFNFYHQKMQGESEKHFQTAVRLLAENSEGMLTSLHALVNPHANTLSGALTSLGDVYKRRFVYAKNWNDMNFLDVLKEPSKITHTVLGDTLPFELIPYEVMERWVVFGLLLIYPSLSDNGLFNLLKAALKNSYVVVLFRDEVIYIHSVIQSFFESAWNNKIGSKRIGEIKETFTFATTHTPKMHFDRRNYLRIALKQLSLIISDEPGLLGPKAFLIFWGLSYASDEVHWVLRHLANHPFKKTSAMSRSTLPTNEDLNDPYLPELLYIIDELRLLVIQHQAVIQRFYLQLLALHDGPGLSSYVDGVLSKLGNDEATIFTAICKDLCDLVEHPVLRDSMKNLTDNVVFDFSGIRLDWLRLQANMSFPNKFNLFQIQPLVRHFHSTVLHTKLVDYIDELLSFVCNLSALIFYDAQLTEMFHNCYSYPNQIRYQIVFPSICSQAIQVCHDMCPEERRYIGQTALHLARVYCQDISDKICSYVFARIDEFGNLSDQLAPQNAVPWLLDEKPSKKGNKRKGQQFAANSKMDTSHHKTALNKQLTSADNLFVPGMESFRVSREDQTTADKTLFTLSQLCFSMQRHNELIIFDTILNPKEILQNEIQLRLINTLSCYTNFVGANDDPDKYLINKPSELLRRIRALMNVLLDLNNHIGIDVISIFSTVFSQQTQPRDAFRGQPTLTAHYTKWYLDHFIEHACQDHFIYSPLLKSFVTLVSPEVVHFRAEDYADLNELLALVELIGPLGMKYMCERLMQLVGDNVEVIKHLVLLNRSTLESLRCCSDKPIQTRESSANLKNSDVFLNVLKKIGVILAFRMLCFEAVNITLEKRTPFLLDSVLNLRTYVMNQSDGKLLPPALNGNSDNKNEIDQIYAKFNNQLVLSNLSASMGMCSHLDYSLCSILNRLRLNAVAAANQTGSHSFLELDYHVACLFMVFFATTFPLLAKQESSLYHLDLDATENNCHCIAYSLNTLMTSMFSLLRPGDLESRFQEFLALSSSNLLRLGLETSSSVVSSDIHGQSNSNNNNQSGSGGNTNHPAKHRDSIYIVFHNLLKQSPYLSASLQESCFPYSLVRSAYHNVAKLTGASVAAITK